MFVFRRMTLRVFARRLAFVFVFLFVCFVCLVCFFILGLRLVRILEAGNVRMSCDARVVFEGGLRRTQSAPAGIAVMEHVQEHAMCVFATDFGDVWWRVGKRALVSGVVHRI